MEAVLGLLLMLLGVCHGVETYCDGRQSGAQCYGALGGTVVFRLMDDASEIPGFVWKKETNIFRWIDNKIRLNVMKDRSLFIPSNGTLRINNINRGDSGEYKLEMFDSQRRTAGTRTLQFTIEGVETYCDGRQSGAQCYGALGGTVVFRLMDDASEIPEFAWKKETKNIFRWIDNKIRLNVMKDRSLFIPSNGTLRINNINRGDSGEYKLEMFDSQRRTAGTRTLQFTVQAPVSSVQLVSECLSQGEMKVSCSPNGGGSLQYSWTLDGHTLRDTELLSGNNETNVITLKQNVSGRLVCSVRNQVSSVSKEEDISTCGVETYCDGRQSGAQCYGALGGTVVFRLMDDASEIPEFAWKKERQNILRWIDNKIILNKMKHRSLFSHSNGTLRINNINRGDSGEYKLEMFDSQRRTAGTRTLQFTVEGVETYCDGRQSGAQCYGALGGTVVFRLMDDASEIPEFAWKKETKNIFRWIDNEIRLNEMKDRSLFIPSNGTLRINNINSGDSGEYKLEMFDSQRRTAGTRTLQFTVEGVETYCDGRQSGTQCYGALGGTVVFRLMDDVSGIPQFVWKKETQNILRWIDNKIILNEMKDRSLFIPSNGTLRINNINRGDSGEYNLIMFDSQRRLTRTRTLQLIVEAPVSSVQLASECLSQGEMKVSCSPNGGDSLQYSWTLDGHTLRDTELLSGNNETNVLTLKQDVSGRLVCSVRNQVSSVSKEEDISTCGFIFIDCMSNGTRISMWVHKENKTLCDEPTTVTVGKDTESLKTSTNNSSCNQTVTLREGFIFIDCTSNGTRISMWVHKENKTLCDEPTTVTVDKDTESLKTSTKNSSCNQTVTLREGSSPLLICGLRTIVVILLLIGISVYFTWKKKKREKAERSAVNLEDSVLMVEMRRSAT
ncbi:matrix-remodeling-associated protein 5 isoform X3 [Melanotaenia boesemani]|uniref:matrix-remodeling-associated protein 5 isoform X3 n=1 Tax=Melanotaenia boesemani TaxID=1250792 RepID=UPI001C03E76A|nr:matrix-remodeling-associated protein 5 isoform X3 [Melanotaenia boesemani]